MGGTRKRQWCKKNPTPFPYHHHYQRGAGYPRGDAINLWIEFVVLIFLASSESFSAGENQRVNKFYSKNLPPSWVRGTKRSFMADVTDSRVTYFYWHISLQGSRSPLRKRFSRWQIDSSALEPSMIDDHPKLAYCALAPTLICCLQDSFDLRVVTRTTSLFNSL